MNGMNYKAEFKWTGKDADKLGQFDKFVLQNAYLKVNNKWADASFDAYQKINADAELEGITGGIDDERYLKYVSEKTKPILDGIAKKCGMWAKMLDFYMDPETMLTGKLKTGIDAKVHVILKPM